VRALLEQSITHLGLSARAVARVLAVARTIAALEGANAPAPCHYSEAISYRSLDRPPAGLGLP
jgi:magnesium chelatase family protein